MSATDRFKMLLATAFERVCVLEAALEERDVEVAHLRAQLADHHALGALDGAQIGDRCPICAEHGGNP